MKTISNYTLVAVAAAAFTYAGIANAADRLQSPRAKANEIRVVPGSTASSVNLANDRPAGNARAWALQRDFRKVASTGPSIDLAHGPRPTMSPRDSRYEAALRENVANQIQIAPLK